MNLQLRQLMNRSRMPVFRSLPLRVKRSDGSDAGDRTDHDDNGEGNRGDSHKKILAVASGGGHWVQLTRMLPAFDGSEIVYLTTLASYRQHVAPARFYTVCDGSQWNKVRLLRMAIKILYVILRERPDVVISTGAAPGYFAVRFGKYIGATTIWVDSIANAEKLSLSGARIGPYADLWLTQWPHLAKAEGPKFEGAVL
jgi:UDP-N-acetylglucosamine:LPS N-acetylglucosamine transferase